MPAPFPAEERDPAFRTLLDDVRESFAALSGQMQGGDLVPSKWRDRIGSQLRAAYREAFTLGARAHDPLYVLGADDLATIRTHLTADLDFLQGFYDDLKASAAAGYRGMTDDYVTNRVGMYADSLNGLWWTGATAAQPPGAWVSWVAEGDACMPCAILAGDYPVDQLNVVPGDTCQGGPRCRCSLVYWTR
jgi:hypothetical protein